MTHQGKQQNIKLFAQFQRWDSKHNALGHLGPMEHTSQNRKSEISRIHTQAQVMGAAILLLSATYP
jgi:hypothetical protein